MRKITNTPIKWSYSQDNLGKPASEQEAQLTLWVADRTAPVTQVQSRGTYLRG